MSRPIVIVGAARAVALVLGILLLGVLGRRLGPTDFGVLQLALAVMVYPALLVDLGLTTLGLRDIAAGRSARDVIPAVLGARLVLAVAVLTVVAIGLVVVPQSDESRLVFAILTLGVPGAAINARWVLQGERRFGASAAVDVATTATQLLAALALVRGPGDAPLAAIALTAATWVTAIVSIAGAGSWRRFRPLVGRGVAALVARSLPLGAAAIAITIYYSVDTLLLGWLRGPQEVAYYAAAYRIILPVLALAGAVGTVAIPLLSSLEATDTAAAGRAATDLARRMILLALPAATGGALVAESIIGLVYGDAFAPSAVPFRILVWSVLTVYLNSSFAFLLLARQEDRRYLAATGLGAAVNVVLNLVAIPLAGTVGAALVTMASEVLVLSLILWWTADVSRGAVPAGFRAAAGPTVAMAVVVWFVRESILAIPLGIVVYGLAVVLTDGVGVAGWLDRLRRAGT